MYRNLWQFSIHKKRSYASLHPDKAGSTTTIVLCIVAIYFTGESRVKSTHIHLKKPFLLMLQVTLDNKVGRNPEKFVETLYPKNFNPEKTLM